MHFIGEKIEKRMKQLDLSIFTLSELAFLPAEQLSGLLENRIPYEAVDDFDQSLLCSALRCNASYLKGEKDQEMDFLDASIDLQKDSVQARKAKIQVRDFLADFSFLNGILSPDG